MPKKEVLAVDAKTGEYYGHVRKPIREKVRYDQWAVLSLSSLPLWLDFLGAPEVVMLLRLAAICDDSNRVTFSQRELAESIGVSRGYANRVIASLLEKGAISKVSLQVYSISPAFMWKGAWSKNPDWQVREDEPSYASSAPVLSGGPSLA